MNKDQFKGRAKAVAGKVKETVGKVQKTLGDAASEVESEAKKSH